MQLTANFHSSEFMHDGISWELLTSNDQRQLQLLAHRLQSVRDVINKPMKVTSGYRTAQHNKKVGGNPNSYHTRGMAADIVVAGMSAPQLQHLLQHWSGGMGCYDSFTHLDIGPKRRW